MVFTIVLAIRGRLFSLLGPAPGGGPSDEHIATGFVSPVSRFPALAFYGPATFLRKWSSRPSPSTRSFGSRPRSSLRIRYALRRYCWNSRLLAPGAADRHGSVGVS